MPPKSKAKVEWTECVNCQKVVYCRDTGIHKQECGNPVLTHSHFSGESFNGYVTPVSNTHVEDMNMSRDVAVDLIFLHPSVMSLMGISMASECVIQNKYSRLAWPSSSVPATSIGVSESLYQMLGVGLASLVSVCLLSGSPLGASEIHLSCRDWKEFYSENVFREYVIQAFCGKLLSLDNNISISYYGQTCDFTVQKIMGHDGHSVKTCSIRSIDEANKAAEELSKLNLSAVCGSSISEAEISTSFTKNSTSVQCTPEKLPKDSPRRTPRQTSTPNIKDSNSSFSSVNDSMFTSPNMKRVRKSMTELCPNFYRVCEGTNVVIQNPKCVNVEDKIGKKGVTFDCIGGLLKQKESIKEMVYLPLQNPDLFLSFGLPLPHGILLYGAGGTGKSMLVEALCNEVSVCNAHIIHVDSSQIISKFYGESESRLRSVFKEAEERAPSLIVMNDVDSLFPRRDNTQNDSQKRLVATLLTLMDGTAKKSAKGKMVLVIATTVRPDSLDPALRRPGRFDRELEISVPSPTDRFEILSKLLMKVPHNLTIPDITEISEKAHGFVGADLAFLCQQASMVAVKREMHVHQGRVELSSVVTREDMAEAYTRVQPSAMREVQLQIPKVYWEDIGGQDIVKLKLKQAVEWPLKHPQSFIRMGIKPPRGILMYGPPGCSKTMIAKALATEAGLNFLAVKGPELFSKWVGESERAVREVFRKARAAAPSIIFFDEIDALAVERGGSSCNSNVGDRVLAQLLTEMDGVVGLQDVTIVAATNRPDMIDKALMRPGRLDRILYVPLPDLPAREDILRIHTRKMPISKDVDISVLAHKTEKYSGAEMAAVCHEAALIALQEDIEAGVVEMRHFFQALLAVTPRISDELIKFYDKYHTKSGLHCV